jgi:DNA-binding protein HU-beta
MRKVELTEHIAKEAGISRKAATKSLEVFVEVIHDALQGKNKRVQIANLGAFRAVERKARKGVNPRTLKKIKIPAMALPRFTAAKALREAVRKTK